eukprot:TRINITY_DN78921_c0_g1_i1.p1 TRINITY_DN78921_c0_g1~~TRINITY_DN78921_c0_g1_i1.p1  ORF type:complete len:364 (-),score=71.50 TRINITY_DN78921_c0_g1_i1:15-1106(-)
MLPRRLVGIWMLGGCVILWVGSSTAVQALSEKDPDFRQPIFVSFFNAGMGSVLLFPKFWSWHRRKTGSRDRAAAYQVELQPTMQLTGTIGMLGLMSQCIFNASLLHTSVATNTVISSSSSVFTFVFSLVILHTPFSVLSFGAASLSFLGCMLVAREVPKDLRADAIHNTNMGNVEALTAAALFSLTSVSLQRVAARDFDTSAYMGLNGVCALMLAPVVLFLADRAGMEDFRLPSFRILLVLVLNALLGCVFANYLYTGALLRLSPLLANAGLSLSIPVSALVDQVFLGEHRFSAKWGIGAALSAAGVVLAAMDLQDEGLSACEKDKSEELQPLNLQEGDEDVDKAHADMVQRCLKTHDEIELP